MTEEWRPIADSPGYEVSDQGRVRSPRRVMSGGTAGRGYRVVQIGGVTRYIHHLVAEAFIGPRSEGLHVRHLDGDMLRNEPSNLAYGSRSDNMRDKRRHGTDHNANKEYCPADHPYDEQNTYRTPQGGRACKICKRENDRRSYRLARARLGVPVRAA